MAKTDPKSGTLSRWTFQGFLNGVRSAFGVGGSRFIPQGGGLQIIPDKALPAELKYAQVSIQNRGSYQTRMLTAESKLKMWRQAHLEAVESKLRMNFHPQNYIRMTLMPHVSTNLLDRVVRDLSITYETAPHRYLESDKPKAPPKPLAEETEEDAEYEEYPTDETEPEEKVEKEAEGEEPVDDEEAAPPITKPDSPFGKKKSADKMEKPVLDTGDEDVDALAALLELEGSATGEETPFDKWIKHGAVDELWETVEWYARFLPCVWVRPYVRYADALKVMEANAVTGVMEEVIKGDPKTAKLEYIIYTPDLADVIVDPNNPTVALAFWYWSSELDSRGDMVRRINFWNKEVFVKLDEQWKVLFIEPHTYGCIPVVPVRLGKPVGSYYLDGTGDDLYEGTLEICVLRTIQNARARDAGFKQLVISGNADQIPAEQVMGGPTPIYTHEEGTATVLDMSPNISEWTELCEKRGMELSAKYGISGAEYKAEGAPQSGFAKKLDRDKILKENKRTRKYFAKAENELYQLTAKILKVQPVGEIGTLPEEEMCVDFAEPSFTEDPKVQSETDAKRLKLNIDSIIDILKRENPDLNETELVKLAHKKKKINDAFVTPDQMKLVDLLASDGALVEGGAPAPGGFGGKPGGPPKPGGAPAFGGKPKPPMGKPPFGAK